MEAYAWAFVADKASPRGRPSLEMHLLGRSLGRGRLGLGLRRARLRQHGKPRREPSLLLLRHPP